MDFNESDKIIETQFTLGRRISEILIRMNEENEIEDVVFPVDFMGKQFQIVVSNNDSKK